MQKKIENKLAELRSTTGEAWTDVKSGIDSAAQSLSTSLRSAASRFA